MNWWIIKQKKLHTFDVLKNVCLQCEVQMLRFQQVRRKKTRLKVKEEILINFFSFIKIILFVGIQDFSF